MRMFLIGCMLWAGSHSMAQGSLDMLKEGSDAGQRAYDQRVAPTRSTVGAVYAPGQVDVAPTYPGGADALNKALMTGCDTSLASTGADCNEDLHYRVRFVVETDGTVSEAEVLGAATCPVLSASMLCRVGQLQRFSPGTLKGGPVRVRLEMGFSFTAE
jgi:hypothetical protein